MRPTSNRPGGGSGLSDTLASLTPDGNNLIPKGSRYLKDLALPNPTVQSLYLTKDICEAFSFSNAQLLFNLTPLLALRRRI
jgi:hypothetical protein